MKNLIPEIISCKNQKLIVIRQIKDESVTIFFKILENVTLGFMSYHIIPIDLVIIMLV